MAQLPTPKELFYKLWNLTLLLEMVRYFFVSVVAAATDIGSFMLFHEHFGMHYITANTIAFILGLTVNYTLSVKFVFIGHARKSSTEFIAFAVIGLFGLLISHMTLLVTIDYIGFPPLAAKLTAVGCTFFWNFFARKILLFSTKVKANNHE